jgi:OOP family OmpA-OmpF porin
MKKIILSVAIALSLFSCKKSVESEASEIENTEISKSDTIIGSKIETDTISFDSSKIKESTADLGTFPYVSPPEMYTYDYEKTINVANIKDVDKEYFAVNGKLFPVEGKSFKAKIEKDRSDGKRFNKLVVEKSYEESILALGGVKVNSASIPNSEIKRVGDSELIDNRYGFSIDYNMLDDIKTFIIKTKDKQIWIQYYLMKDESGSITVLEQAI